MNEPRRVYHDSECAHYTLVTDSSLQGFGGIIFSDDDGDAIFAGIWNIKGHINFLELRTIRAVLEQWTPKKCAEAVAISLDVIVDNTSTKHQLRKQWSPCFEYNAEIQRLQDYLAENHMFVNTANYIQTNANPADFLTRLTRQQQLVAIANYHSATPEAVAAMRSEALEKV